MESKDLNGKNTELRKVKTNNISGNFFTNSLQIVQERFVLPHLKPFFNHTSQLYHYQKWISKFWTVATVHRHVHTVAVKSLKIII